MLAPLLAAQLTVAAAVAAPPAEVWAGHQVVYGTKPILMFGELKTQTDSYVLARVTRDGDALVLEQEACEVTFAEALGVQALMPPATLRRLPDARIRLTVDAKGAATATPWRVAWGSEDIDGDGNPGVTVGVESRMCGGELYVTSDTLSSVSGARLTDGGLTGQIAVTVEQQILGASRSCLLLGGEEQRDQQQGRFAYRRVDAATTCDDLRVASWPVRAAP